MSKKNPSLSTSASTMEQDAKQMMKSGLYQDASRLWYQLAQKEDSFAYARHHVNCLVRMENLTEAAKHSALYAENWPDKPIFKFIQLEQAYHQRSWDAAAPLWEKMAENTGPKAELALSLIWKLLRSQDYKGALNAAEQAKSHWLKNDKIIYLYQQLESLFGNDGADTSLVAKSCDPGMTKLVGEASPIAILESTDEYIIEKIDELLLIFLQRWPDSTAVTRLLLENWWNRGDFKKIIDYCEESHAKTEDQVKLTLRMSIQALLELGQVERATAVMHDAGAEEPLRGAVKKFLIDSIGKGLGTNTELKSNLEDLCQKYSVSGIIHAVNFDRYLGSPQRPLIDFFDAKQSVVASPQTPAECLVIVFTGFNRQLGSLPQGLLDHFFAGQGMAMVRLIDFSECAYLNGISGLGNNLNETLEAINRMAKAYGASRIVTVGNSVGGAGAILYGTALNASHVLAFSPATNANIDFLEANDDHRGKAMARRFNRLFSSSSLDLRKFIDNTPFTGRIDVYAGENSKNDISHINHLKGLKNVHQHSIQGISGHDCIGPALLDGTLLKALKRLV